MTEPGNEPQAPHGQAPWPPAPASSYPGPPLPPPPYPTPSYPTPSYPYAYPPPPYQAGPYPPAPSWPHVPPVPPVRRGTPGWVWGVVAAGVALFVALVLGGGWLLLTSGPQAYGESARLDALWDACDRGDLGACDRLYYESPFFSEYEDFGATCGGRTDGTSDCAS
jgi:hypothetical protein